VKAKLTTNSPTKRLYWRVIGGPLCHSRATRFVRPSREHHRGHGRALRHSQTELELLGRGPTSHLEARQRHADQPDAFGWGKHRPHETDADGAQGFLGRDDRTQGSAARGLLEIGVLDLHRHGPAKGPRLLAPGPDLIGHRLHASLDVGRLCQVVGEGRFRSRGLARAPRDDRTMVLAIGDGVELRTGLAEVLLQEC